MVGPGQPPGFPSAGWDLPRAQLPRRSRGRATAILLTHRRPANMALVVRSALLMQEVRDVVVSNNHPDLDVEDVVDIRHPRLRLRNDVGVGATRRLLLAAELSADRQVFAPDDDLLFRPDVADGMLRRQVGTGTVLAPQGAVFLDPVWQHALRAPPERPVDVANRAYAFTAEMARRAVELASDVGMPVGSVAFSTEPIDDVLLSHAGNGPPRLVEAPFDNCRSTAAEDIATFRRPRFDDVRSDLVRRLRPLVGRAGSVAADMSG